MYELHWLKCTFGRIINYRVRYKSRAQDNKLSNALVLNRHIERSTQSFINDQERRNI